MRLEPSAFVLRFVLLLAVTSVPRWATAQGYQVPPPELARFVDAPSSPSVSVSPTRTTLAIMPGRNLPTIADLAQPELRIAGLRINPRITAPSRMSYATGLSLVELADGAEREVTGLPEGVRIGSIAWSPDGQYVALKEVRDDGIYPRGSWTLRPPVHTSWPVFGSRMPWAADPGSGSREARRCSSR